jgi:hypothetical protein
MSVARAVRTPRSSLSVDGAPFVLVGGAVAQRPGRAGHAWVYLQWLLGLRALGCHVMFVDRLQPGTTAAELVWLRDVFAAHDIPVLLAGRDRIPRADLLLDVMGYADVDADQRVFVDVDPGFGQLWAELGLHDPYGGYDSFVTVGTAIASPDCTVPTRGLDWIPTLPPVFLPQWPVAAGGPTWTTVGSWRGPFGPIEHRGVTYGLRVHEFRRLLGVPAAAQVDIELALDIDPADDADRRQLLAAGFHLADPAAVAGTLDGYRRHLQSSAGELCVAKNLYVATRGGWFSDRSCCYLASGRPVVAQETGWTATLPAGTGLLAFTDAAEATEALSQVAAAPGRHERAAREIAESYLASDVVLGGLLDRLGAAPVAAQQLARA